MESGGTSSTRNPNCWMVLGESSSNNNGNVNNNMNGSLCSIMMMNSSAGTTSDHNNKAFLPPNLMMPPPQQQEVQYDCTDNSSNSIKAGIFAHPHFPRLLASYVNCQKVGAPAQVVARLDEACASGEAIMSRSSAGTAASRVGDDPALDQFMEAYCEMLTKYEQELTKPFKDASLFLSEIDAQLKTLTVSSNISGQSGSSEEEIDVKDHCIDPLAEDRDLKDQLLRRYSGSLGSLKQEFLKKKKKGKLPKEARQLLLDWWSRHHRWPYPSEPQKLALAESTGLDQKQINNWFINQRKRHWKPSEDMQFVMMDAAYPQYYMENGVGNPFPMDCTTLARF
ncbi:hypothetical protein CUMW_230120 [Citrus unshiu]|uniref:Homeobox domain-containing protein n=1 Tax=Citrus unshiu TaxID=55188 RepID=A0A2H5QH93_CITUN|nr:hypothetical protein CUMW_230120 [Citrus unshiu]